MLDSSDEESGGFKINEAYASKYNEWRRREELQKRKLAWIGLKIVLKISLQYVKNLVRKISVNLNEI